MPAWGQAILGAASIVVAVYVLGGKVVKPLLKGAKAADRMYPVLDELTKVFADVPNAFLVLYEIQAQFRTDSGSSARDLLNRLEAAAQENVAAGELLKVGVEASRQLAERDRQEVQRLLVLMDRMAQMQKGVADNLDGVASELADSHRRADQVHHTEPPGSASGAASKQTETEKELP